MNGDVSSGFYSWILVGTNGPMDIDGYFHGYQWPTGSYFMATWIC